MMELLIYMLFKAYVVVTITMALYNLTGCTQTLFILPLMIVINIIVDKIIDFVIFNILTKGE